MQTRHSVRRRTLLGMLPAGLAGLATTSAWSQAAYPARPVRLIVPYPAGGNTDVIVRVVTAELGKRLGQPVVIDNKPGATVIIGTDAIAKAPPDGYTLGLLTTSHAINPMLFKSLPYDSKKDFELISWMATLPLVLASNEASGIRRFPDLVAYAKANPGKLNYASAGNGSVHHILMEWVAAMAGIQVTHIPYKGTAPAIADLLGGQVQVMFSGLATLTDHTRTGRVIPLGITSPTASPMMPNVPPIASFLPKFDVSSLGYGIGAPVGVPRSVVARLNQEIVAVLALSEVRGRLFALGAEPQSSSLQQASSFISRDVQQWERILAEARVKPEQLN